MILIPMFFLNSTVMCKNMGLQNHLIFIAAEKESENVGPNLRVTQFNQFSGDFHSHWATPSHH